jgi:hypothetical protein
MSIRLDPRRVNALKHLAGETGMRPGDLVRQWVEERIDALRVGPAGKTLEDRVEELTARMAVLESAAGISASAAPDPVPEAIAPGSPEPAAPDLDALVEAGLEPPDTMKADQEQGSTADEPEPEAESSAPKRRTNAVSAIPSERVALHDEMIAVLRERGPMTAADLATAVAERGRYAPPRSGKPLDAAMVSQRVSNPVYRSRFTRDSGRIGLAEGA